MEEKKDIGSFFKDRLSEGKKSPNNNLWNRIDTSLDELAMRKKNRLPYRLVGIVIPLILALFLLFNPFKEDKKNLQKTEKKYSVKFTSSPKEQSKDEKEIPLLKEDSLNIKTELENTDAEMITNSEKNSNKITQNGKEEVLVNKTKKSSSKNPSIDETFKVSKKYYYYNSEDKEQWSTTDENKIDSLLSNENENVETPRTKLNDSLIE